MLGLFRNPRQPYLKSAVAVYLARCGWFGDAILPFKSFLLQPSLKRAVHPVYQGTLNSSLIRIAEVLEMPIHHHSAGVIFAHNHPSNDPTPSPEDILVTGQLVDACKLHDIEALDHVIVCQSGHVSMKERGLGFKRY